MAVQTVASFIMKAGNTWTCDTIDKFQVAFAFIFVALF